MIIWKKNEPSLARALKKLKSYLKFHYLNIVILNFFSFNIWWIFLVYTLCYINPIPPTPKKKDVKLSNYIWKKETIKSFQIWTLISKANCYCLNLDSLKPIFSLTTCKISTMPICTHTYLSNVFPSSSLNVPKFISTKSIIWMCEVWDKSRLVNFETSKI